MWLDLKRFWVISWYLSLWWRLEYFQSVVDNISGESISPSVTSRIILQHFLQKFWSVSMFLWVFVLYHPEQIFSFRSRCEYNFFLRGTEKFSLLKHSRNQRFFSPSAWFWPTGPVAHLRDVRDIWILHHVIVFMSFVLWTQDGMTQLWHLIVSTEMCKLTNYLTF